MGAYPQDLLPLNKESLLQKDSLKVHLCRFENLPICFLSYQNNVLKISHFYSKEFSSYLPVKFVNFLKIRLTFNIFYCFWMFVSKFSHISRAHISKSKRLLNAKSSAYCFHMKKKILSDFQICISVPLRVFKLIKSTKTQVTTCFPKNKY